MDQILIEINKFLWPKMVWVHELIKLLTPDAWALLFGLTAFFGIIGWRLCWFTKPGSPRMSQLIRHASRFLLFLPSVAALLPAGLVWVFFFCLCFVLNILPRGWAALHAEIMGVAWGLTSGLLSGGMFFYWLVPGYETPAITSAAPNAKLAAIPNYDPEKYFRV